MARTGKAPAKKGRLLSTLQSTGVRKGVLGGSRTWTMLAVGAWGLRMLIRLAQRNEEIVFSEELKPGQRLVIANGRATLDAGPGPQ
jgi:hypothetical protein